MSKPRRVEPLPGDPLGKRLCQTFPYLWKAIVKANDADSNWQTLNGYPLRPRELWRFWQDAAYIVGVRFDSVTRYGMIDLDARGAYHPNQNAQALPVIRAALETIGITRTFLTQSSSSGGLHLWLPLPEQTPTFGLAAAIRQCLEAQGLTVKQGQLEIFPNCKAYARAGEFTEYQGHRLPLQPATGAQLLNDDLTPIVGGLERFFQIWDHCAVGQDIEQVRQAIAQAQKNWKRRSLRRDSLSVESWRTALELEIREGWTDHGQTNHLLKQIACYGVVFQGLTGKNLLEYVQHTATNSPGYTQWCRHQHEIALRCSVWARAAENYYWTLGTEGKRQGNIYKTAGVDAIGSVNLINQARAEDAQARITKAFNQLQEAGQLALYKTKTALENAIIKLAQCSKQTTRKYLHLWYIRASDVDVFAGDASEMNATETNITEGNAIEAIETNITEKGCTNDDETVSAPSKPTLTNPQESLKSLPDQAVHTQPYMKGLISATASSSDLFQLLPSRGGAGGLSTDLKDGISRKLPSPNTATRAIVPVLKRDAKAIQASNNTSKYQDDLRYEFGRLASQMGWSLERVKEFIQQILGKTLQTLGEDDWILLVYQIQNLTSST